MKVEEINTEGLNRKIEVTVLEAEWNLAFDKKCEILKNQVNLKGFRQGKVPVSHLKKIYGQKILGETIEELLSRFVPQVLSDRQERPALRPDIHFITQFDDLLSHPQDVIFTLTYEIIPPIVLMNLADIKLNRKNPDITDNEVQQGLERLVESRKQFILRNKTAKSRMGDSLKIDFIGRVDGQEFENGSAQNFDLVLGSGQFLPGFEDQLVGKKSGEKIDVTLIFPKDYKNNALADKEGIFEVTIHEISEAKVATIDDTLAISLGLESLEKVKEMIREQLSADYKNFSRSNMKRDIIDILVTKHVFEVPKKMLDMEFEQIWQHFEQDLKKQGKNLNDLDTTEKELRTEYKKMADRRVSSALIFAEIGRQNNIEISDDEVNKGVMEYVGQYPGQKKQVLDHFRKNPEALSEIRAPLFEEKVVDFILEQADITEITVGIEDVMEGSKEKKSNKSKLSKGKKTKGRIT